MAAPTASLVLGKTDWGGGAPVLRENTTGMFAEQFWLITNATSESAAHGAQYLPELNKPFSSEFPTLKVVDREFSRIGGVYNTTDQAGVHYSCRIQYSTPNGGGRLPDPIPGTRFSRFRNGTTTIHRTYDARLELGTASFFYVEPAPGTPGSTPPLHPVDNGRGYQTEVGVCEIEIVSYYAPGELTDLQVARMIQLQQYGFVNRDAITIPKLYGVDDAFTFRIGELKYQAFSLGGDRGVVELSQLVRAAPDHFNIYAEESEQGEAEGEPILVVQYPAANFAGLW